MPAPLRREGTGWVFTVNSTVLVIGDGSPTEAAVQALQAHTVYWVGETARPGALVKAYPDSTVVEVRGQRGHFRVKLAGAKGKLWLECGNIVLAPRLLSQLDPSLVLPLSCLILPVSRAPLIPAQERQVAFYLGEGENEGSFSSVTALNAAIRWAEHGARVYFFFLEIKVAALGLEDVYGKARRLGVRFFRLADPSALQIFAEGQLLRVHYRDTSLPGLPEFSFAVETLFAGEVYRPGPDFSHLADILRVNRDRWGFLQADDVRLFPVRTNRPGVYVLGEVRGPGYATEVKLEAAAIAGETAPFLSGEIVVPKVLARIDSSRCSLCLNCYRNCPASAVNIDYEAETAVINPLACQGCGLCAADCPAKAITLPQFEPLSDQRQGKTIILACENSGHLAARSIPLPLTWRAKLEIIPIPCAAWVDEVMVLKALSQGALRIVVSACRQESCRSSSGNRRVEEKVLAIKERLKTIGFNPGRIELLRSSANAPQEWQTRIAEIITGDEVIVEVGR